MSKAKSGSETSRFQIGDRVWFANDSGDVIECRIVDRYSSGSFAVQSVKSHARITVGERNLWPTMATARDAKINDVKFRLAQAVEQHMAILMRLASYS